MRGSNEWGCPGVQVESGVVGPGWALRTGFSLGPLGLHHPSRAGLHDLCLQVCFSLLDLSSVGARMGPG